MRFNKKIDRKSLEGIVAPMLARPYRLDKVEEAFKGLEDLLSKARSEAAGLMYSHACVMMDEGRDIRHEEVPAIMEVISEELSK